MDSTLIICGGCGEVYAVGKLYCPECRRCPACGNRFNEENVESCWNCGFPNDPDKVEEVKAAWKPDDPANSWLHRQRADDNRWKEYSPRINWWLTGVFLIGVFLAFNVVALAIGQLPAVGIAIPAGIAQTLLGFYASWCIRRIGTGRWPRFLRPAQVDSTAERS